jgi:hypothetical protein
VIAKSFLLSILIHAFVDDYQKAQRRTSTIFTGSTSQGLGLSTLSGSRCGCVGLLCVCFARAKQVHSTSTSHPNSKKAPCRSKPTGSRVSGYNEHDLRRQAFGTPHGCTTLRWHLPLIYRKVRAHTNGWHMSYGNSGFYPLSLGIFSSLF